MALRLKPSFASVSLRRPSVKPSTADTLASLLPYAPTSTWAYSYVSGRRSSQLRPLRPTKRLQSSFSPAAADDLLRDSRDTQNSGVDQVSHETRVTSHEQGRQQRRVLQRQGSRASPAASPLSLLNMTQIVRSLAVNTISSSPFLLHPSLTVMAFLANSHSAIFNPDRNPFLRWLLKRTFYAQYCGGENQTELRRTMGGLKQMGYEGVILVYAKEVDVDHTNEGTGVGATPAQKMVATAEQLADIETWKNGTLETVRLTEKGDMIALKLSGAGSLVNHHLTHRLPPPSELDSAMTAICDLASARSVKLLVDAEHASMQAGIDDLGIHFSRLYNRSIPGQATVYGTYQAYLKAAPQVLASHMAIASKEGFTLGVKLVRGAYMSSDPRHLIHDTKAATDRCFDGIMESLMRKTYNDVLTPITSCSSSSSSSTKANFPAVNLVLASHNAESVRKAQSIEKAQTLSGEPDMTDLVYAQLMGMADEVSCELLQAGQGPDKVVRPRAYKYLVWGTTGECMKYLHRRALENRDAVGRTKEARDLLARELWRRTKGVFAMT